MKCYRYNPKTFEYIGEEEASRNYATSGNEWLIPGSCTTQQPPAPKNGYVVIFDRKLQSWYHEVDNRETLVTDKETRQTFQYGKIGPIPDTLTTVELNPEYREYVVFDEETQAWIFDETKREAFLEYLWELRKKIRSIKCESDINYNGHLVHVDPTSFNDIMLAFQNAVFMNDMTTTRRWMCANGPADFSGQDFLQILQLYGARREQLVFESNESWQNDTMKRGEHLLMTLTELNAELRQLQLSAAV